MERDEQVLKQNVKSKILEQAKFMEYNDDFDSEDEMMGARPKKRATQQGSAKTNSRSRGREKEKDDMDQ